jgi:phenylpropionate dioxygenase-like ring-hydroxylating dioxygenase large terminal subunit
MKPMTSDPVLVHDWHPVARVEDVPQGSPIPARLLGEDLVLWRAGSRWMAWQDLCIHRGARLSQGSIQGETLTCPYHGWVYGASGQCVRIPAHPEQTPPARAKAQTYPVQERYGLLWACLGEPAQDIPAFPEWDDPSYRKVLCGPYRVKAAGPRVMENFLDVAHFPFVHGGLLGSALHPQIEDYEAEITPQGVVARTSPSGSPTRMAAGRAESRCTPTAPSAPSRGISLRPPTGRALQPISR